MLRTWTTAFLLIATLPGCEPLGEARDISGNFTVEYVDNLRVYIGDELVAEISSGEDETIEWNGETFQASAVCGSEGTDCPSETYWAEVGVEQPWGPEYRLVNFVNLDTEVGTPGQRMGGRLDDFGKLEMLAGLQLAGNENCAAIGVGSVHGTMSLDNKRVESGIVRYEWGGGCNIDGVEIGASFKLETDFVATRTGDLDLSSVTPEPPMDDDGDEVDPESPDEEYAAGGTGAE